MDQSAVNALSKYYSDVTGLLIKYKARQNTAYLSETICETDKQNKVLFEGAPPVNG